MTSLKLIQFVCLHEDGRKKGYSALPPLGCRLCGRASDATSLAVVGTWGDQPPSGVSKAGPTALVFDRGSRASEFDALALLTWLRDYKDTSWCSWC
jgi:hypothetical protein